ncbi:MAG: BACON domain-containing protein [Rikenellaceae bacterium]|nr:BACON domain-containing protein [Rikenellaceae bacterium]
MKPFLHISYNLALTAILILTSCTKDSLEGINGNGGIEDFTVTLSFQLPETEEVDTKMSSAQETDIQELLIVWFEQNGDYVHKAVGLELDGSGSVKTCRILMNEGIYDIMVFANSESWFNTIYPMGIPSGTTIDQFASAMVASAFQTWTGTTIPMWGIKQAVTIDRNNDAVTGISLAKSLARIDISVDASVTSIFQMEEVAIHRNYQKGRLIPELDTDYWNFSAAKALKPSLPTGADLVNNTGKTFNVTGGINLSNEIYVFETPAGEDLSDSSNDQNVCLVIKGKFNNGASSYYRIDFNKNSSTTAEYIDLLRNNIYKITIKGVDRDGAPSADEALSGRPSNIVYDISEVSKRGMNNIAWNGQHYLMASIDTMYFHRNAGSASLRVQTNHESGWKVSDKPAWVTVTPSSSEYTDESLVTVTVQQNPSTTAIRIGQITLIAGELELKVNIEQSELDEFSLTVDPSSLVFYAAPTAPATVNVTTVPAGLTYTLTYNTDEITWATKPAGNSLYTASFDLRPANNTSGRLLVEVLTVSVTHSDGRVLREDISIRQYSDNNPFSVVTESPYPAIAQTDAWLDVTSSQNWYFKRSIPSGLVSFNSLGMQASGYSRQYFTITANDSYTDRDIVFVFSTWDDTIEHEETIVQEGVVPYFYFHNETMSDLYEHTFTGVTGETHTIGFDHNFAWRFSETGMGNLLAASSHSPGTIYPCAVISEGHQETLSFRSVDYTNRSGMPAAGTVITASAQIYSENTNSYPSSLKGTINLKRTISTVFDLVNPTASSVGDIPRTGGTVTLTGGSNDSWYMYAVHEGNTITSSVVSQGSYYETNSVTVTIPEITSFGSGTDVDIYYHYDGQNYFVTTYRQDQYHITVNSARGSHSNGYLYGVGDVLTFNIEGNYPALQLRVVERSGGTAPSQIISVSAGTRETGLTFDIPMSDETNRNKVFVIEYSPDGGINWTALNNITSQYPPNYFDSNRFYALNYADNVGVTTMTWAEAMGIDTHYNNASYYNSYGNTDRDNPSYTPTEATGCGSYTEPVFYSNSWRLPPPQYVSNMLRLQANGDYNFGISEGQKFLTSHDNGMNRTRVYWLENGQIMEDDNADKNDVYYVRCIYRSN